MVLEKWSPNKLGFFNVFQVHYLNVHEISQRSQGDTSGVYLYYTRQPQPKIAGMLSLHVNTK
jgi:hypothetical protein